MALSMETTVSACGSSLFEQCDSRAEVVPIVRLVDRSVAVDGDHVGAGLGAQAPKIDLARTLQADHVLLAAFGVEARLVVVVEERVQTSAVDENIRATKNTKAPCFLARVCCAIGESRVVVGGLWWEGGGGDGVGLHVRSLGLDDTHVDVLRVGQLIVV